MLKHILFMQAVLLVLNSGLMPDVTNEINIILIYLVIHKKRS